MPSPVYKYLGPDVVDLVLANPDCVQLKLSYPKDFQDPYELALTIDFEVGPEALAFYQDAVGELPQLPTTCFSKSPSVIPMWAHYAFNLEGAVFEFDEDLVQKSYPDSLFGDVEYREGPHECLNALLSHAHVTLKPRHVYFLQNGVFHAAYFSKASCWSHELERRMVVPEDGVESDSALMLIDIPTTCITSVIAGHSASEATKDSLRAFATRTGARYLEMRIGRSTPVPFFIDETGIPHQFNGEAIEPSEHYCAMCDEPVLAGELCSWCAMEDAHRIQAAADNPFRMIASAGLLDSYLEGMREIGRKLGEDDA